MESAFSTNYSLHCAWKEISLVQPRCVPRSALRLLWNEWESNTTSYQVLVGMYVWIAENRQHLLLGQIGR